MAKAEAKYLVSRPGSNGLKERTEDKAKVLMTNSIGEPSVRLVMG